MTNRDEYLSTRQAAEFLGSTVNSLTSMRCAGAGPVWSRDKDGFHVRYRKSDLEAYLARRNEHDRARARAAAIVRGEV